MADRNLILVTGATGKVGRQLVPKLLAAGAGVRALTRHPETAALPDGVEVVAGDLSDTGAMSEWLDGVDGVFLLWPLTTADAAPDVVDLLAKHVDRVVYLSSDMPDGKHPAGSITGSHASIERIIERSRLRWTFLRPTGFASNTLGWARQIRAGEVVRWPYAASARSLIHERDIAAVGALALTRDGHAGRRYVLSGPRTVTQAEQVRDIGDAIGRPLRFEEISREEARERLLADGWPPSFAEGALDTWARMVAEPERVTGTVEQLTGTPARTFRQWAEDHADDFR